MVQIKKDNAVTCAKCGNAYFESEGKCPRCGETYEEGKISDAEREFHEKFDTINDAIRDEQTKRNKHSTQNPYPSTKGSSTDIISDNNK